MDNNVTVEGTVNHIIFENKETSYIIMSFEVIDKGLITCTGVIPYLKIGETLKIEGEFVNHKEYGKQLNIKKYERLLPTAEDDIIKYLSSGIIKGVRKRTAKKIVNAFGMSTFLIIEQSPQKLESIEGISAKKAADISKDFKSQSSLRKALIYLQKYDISTSLAYKIAEEYKDKVYDILEHNPYVLCKDIHGVGFSDADRLAEKIDIDKLSPHRIRAGINHILEKSILQGHVYLKKSELISKSANMLDVSHEQIEVELFNQLKDADLKSDSFGNEDAFIYIPKLHTTENYIAYRLITMLNNNIRMNQDELYKSTLDDIINNFNNIKLSKNQHEAVVKSIENNILIITGGPGTGKTTLINIIIRMFSKLGYVSELAAPTGKAAKRLSNATGLKTNTIHKLLESVVLDNKSLLNDYRKHKFNKNEYNPIEADVIVIDEASMIDIFIMNSLLKAIKDDTKLILIGDVDQLPSVGPGCVLKDIINSNLIKTVKLNKIFRQDRESLIVTNAHKINNGIYPTLTFDKKSDFMFFSKDTEDDIKSTIIIIILKLLNDISYYNIQVLTPMRLYNLGSASLNNALQDIVNPKSKDKNEIESRGIIFREKDKVIQIKNNYNLEWSVYDKNKKCIETGTGIFNGDEGIISEINNDYISVLFDGNRIVKYDSANLNELELSYALTIHKAQGSEYEVVIIPIGPGYTKFMSRNLLYTGLTRAKKLAIIVGIKNKIFSMVDNNVSNNDRNSSLMLRMQRLHDNYEQ